MTWFLYVRGLRGPQPQIIFDGLAAPVICEGIRGLVIKGTVRKLTPDEDSLVRVGRLSLAELERRYPPPREGGAPEPPKTPGAIAARPADAVPQLEVA